MIAHPLHLITVIAVTAALAFWLDRRVAMMSKIGASLLAIGLGALLSNTGLVPGSSPVYGAVTGPVTSLAIAWLVMSVNLRDLRQAGGRMVGAFALAVIGTGAGVLTGATLFADAFGPQNARLAGALMGTYSGGSVNFISVGRGLELEPRLFAAATAADNLTTGLWMAATLLLPLALRRWYPPVPGEPPRMDAGDQPAVDAAAAEPVSRDGERPGAGENAPASPRHPIRDAHPHPFFAPAPVSASRLALLLAAGLVLLAAADAMAQAIPAVPSVLWLTTFALIVGQMPFLARPDGTIQLGNLALTLFFVVIGIYSRMDRILEFGIEVFLVTVVVVAVHGLVVYGGGRLLRMDLGTLSVASQAAIGGPSSALAVAVGREWHGLVLPGIIVGLAGYAIGTYLGFAVAALL